MDGSAFLANFDILIAVKSHDCQICRMPLQQKKNYVAPQVKVAEFRVENGYSASSNASIILEESRYRIEMESRNGEPQVQQYHEDSHFYWGF